MILQEIKNFKKEQFQHYYEDSGTILYFSRTHILRIYPVFSRYLFDQLVRIRLRLSRLFGHVKIPGKLWTNKNITIEVLDKTIFMRSINRNILVCILDSLNPKWILY